MSARFSLKELVASLRKTTLKARGLERTPTVPLHFYKQQPLNGEIVRSGGILDGLPGESQVTPNPSAHGIQVGILPTQPLLEDLPLSEPGRASLRSPQFQDTSEIEETGQFESLPTRPLPGSSFVSGVDDVLTQFREIRALPAMPETGPIIKTGTAGTQNTASDPVVKIAYRASCGDTDQIVLPRAVPERSPHIPWRRSPRLRYIHQKRLRKSQLQERKKRLAGIWVSIVLALLLTSFSISINTSYTFYQSKLPHLQELLNQRIEQSTRIYDRHGQLLYTLYDPNKGKSVSINYDQIPGVLQDAQTAAEDKTFWTNAGVDFQATFRSAVVDLAARRVETGASTLTQQVIKNLSQDTDISSQRKLNEAVMAMGLTQTYPKWKILEMYFNVASYGAQNRGVEAAVEDYFGLRPNCDRRFRCAPAVAFLDRDLLHCTDPSDESTCGRDPLMALARASLLASLPQNPVNFDPLLFAANVSGLLDRQDYVLQQMLQAHMQINLGLGSQTQNAGEITTEVVRQVEDLSQHMQFVGFHNELKAPHFVWWVIRTLANILGNHQQINPQTGLSSPGLHLLLSGGFNIRTTLDLNLETYVERAVQRHLNQPERQKLTGKLQTLSKDNNIHNASTIVMDAHSGEILAMDGSADWTDSDPRIGGQLNSALLAHQSASTFKPIIMAAAFELGWYPGIVLNDTLTYFPLEGVAQRGGLDSFHTYTPTDYGNTYSGQGVNLAFAMSNSLNVPSVKAYMFAGKQNVYSMARRLGITSITPGQINATSALGTAEVPLLQMVGAYQVFANAGRHALPQSILSISDNAGHLFYTYDVTHPAGGQVISPQIAYMVTSLLSDKQARAYPFANDQDLLLHDWKLPDGTFPDVAVRTGTTDYFKDNWAIGYTPDLVVGVWEGNSNGAPAITDSLAPTVAVPLWHSVVEYASGHCNQAHDQIPCPPFDLRVPAYHFSVPAGLVRQEVNTFNGLAGTGYTSWMLKNERPVQTGW